MRVARRRGRGTLGWWAALVLLNGLLAGRTASACVGLWDARTGRLLRELDGSRSSGRALAFSPDGRLLAGGDYRGCVKLWRVESGELAAISQLGAGEPRSLAFSPDGRVLAVASGGGGIELFVVRE